MTTKKPTVAKILTASSVTLLVNGKTLTATKDSHPSYLQIREAVGKNDYDTAIALLDTATMITDATDGRVSVKNGEVLFNGKPVHNGIATRIIETLSEGHDATSLIKFLDNLLDNPSFKSVQQISRFIEACNLPITDDGHLIAWKRVRGDYKDFYTGTIDNSVGLVVEMPRNEVEDDPEITCSYGLHFCAESYLSQYHGGDGRIIMLKINPRDIVSIPTDYNNAKGRCCRYEVIADVGEYVPSKDHFDTKVVKAEEVAKKTSPAKPTGKVRFVVQFEPTGDEEEIVYHECNDYSEALLEYQNATKDHVWTQEGVVKLIDLEAYVVLAETEVVFKKEKPVRTGKGLTGVKGEKPLNPKSEWPFPTASKTVKPTSPAVKVGDYKGQVVTIKQAAVILGKSESEVKNDIAKGKLTTRRKHGRPYVVIK